MFLKEKFRNYQFASPECCFIDDILNLCEKPQNNLVHTLKFDCFWNLENLKINAVQADRHSLLPLRVIESNSIQLNITAIKRD